MKANRVHQYGPPSVILYEDVDMPSPGVGELLVRVHAAGVGPWDALVRSGHSGLPQPLPLTLGAEVAGVIESAGAGVEPLRPGDDVFGSTNARFVGGYAEYAVAAATMIATKPASLGFVEAASLPVVAVTARQMLFDHAHIGPGQVVLVHGAAGSVGAFAVQLAHAAGANVMALARAGDLDYVRGLGADRVLDYDAAPFEQHVSGVDVVIDTVGGELQTRSLAVLNRGGILVSVVQPADADLAMQLGVRAEFFIVDVNARELAAIAELFAAGRLTTTVGIVLPLSQARTAHEMLGGAKHARGKIVLAAD